MRRKLLALLAVILAAQVVVACSTTPQGAQTVSPLPPSDVAGTLAVQALGLNIPWAVGGERIERDGSLKVNGGDWPTVPFRALRLWDTRTAWLNLEPAPDQWTFGQLDALVAKARANGVTDITLVLAGTPQWAASSFQSTDASWMGPGSASMPADVAAWQEYVATVVGRYAGQITSYEIGNEPNLLTFWSGTPDQYAQLVSTAAATIRATDPSAKILVNGGLVRSKFDVATLAKWLSPMSASGLARTVDAVSLHVYPTVATLGSPTRDLLTSMKSALAANGWGSVPAWITEVNVRDGARLSAADQASAVKALGQQLVSAGFDRAYWYAWTDLGTDQMVQFQPGSGGAAALAAFSGAPAPAPAATSAAATPQPTQGPAVPTPAPTVPASPTDSPTAPADPTAPASSPDASTPSASSAS
ncbi:MAG: cellulase family glycosylhydrolase [Candidatus Nanopelagicales bacterium]